MQRHNTPQGVYKCLEECGYAWLGPGAPAWCPDCGGCVERLARGQVTVADTMRARRTKQKEARDG